MPPDGACRGAMGDVVPDERERAAWIAFSRVAGIGAQRTRRMIDRFGCLADAWDAPVSAFAGLGLDRRTMDALREARREGDGRRDLDWLERLDAVALTWLDAAYPPALIAVVDCPPVLYVRGRVDALMPPAVAIVGTRRATGYGRDQAERFAGDLVCAGWVVASGLARGIDTHAHRGALAARPPSGSTGVATIGVLGHGIDTIYPPENRGLAAQIAERGAIVSDYPLGTGPTADHFPARNRIISGLSLGTLVIEAPPGSGALITATYANEQGRQVFALPGPVTSPASEGCHVLIQAGARLATRAEDIVMDLLPTLATVGREPAVVTPKPEPRPQLPLDLAGAPPSAAASTAALHSLKTPSGVVRSRPRGRSSDDNGDDVGAEVAQEGPGQVEARIFEALRDSGTALHVDDLVRACGVAAPEVTSALMVLELEGRVRDNGGMTFTIPGPRRG